MLAVQMGGVLMIIAAIICFVFINEKKNNLEDELRTAELEIENNRSV
jgi:maltose/moltooligosaccharide transporter